MSPRLSWITVGYQVVAGTRIEERREYDQALELALRWIEKLTESGMEPTVASESVQLIRLQALRWSVAQ